MPVVVLATLWGGKWLRLPAILRPMNQAVTGEYRLIAAGKHTTSFKPAFLLYNSVLC